jgi:hypothetical protein
MNGSTNASAHRHPRLCGIMVETNPKSNHPMVLTDLAQRINEKHNEAEQALKSGFAHAIAAGELLLEAKATVPHGEWLSWLAKNCTVAERTAQLYMKVARGRQQLEGKNASLADLTLEGAAQQLLGPTAPTPDQGRSPISRPDVRHSRLPLTDKPFRKGNVASGNEVPAYQRAADSIVALEEHERVPALDVAANALDRRIITNDQHDVYRHAIDLSKRLATAEGIVESFKRLTRDDQESVLETLQEYLVSRDTKPKLVGDPLKIPPQYRR